MELHLEVPNVWNVYCMHYGTVYVKCSEIMCERRLYFVAHTIDFFRGIHLVFASFPYGEQFIVGQSPKFHLILNNRENFSHFFCRSGILSWFWLTLNPLFITDIVYKSR